MDPSTVAACRALYETAFPDEDAAFLDTLFACYAPECLRVKRVGGNVASMLFSIPYPIQTKDGVLDARYLYAVATAPEYRGQGLARALLAEEMARGLPVFLRPMQPSLFDFYRRAGLVPFAPYRTVSGQAGGVVEGLCELDANGYRAARARFLNEPYCQPTADYLHLAFPTGGAVGEAGVFCALYEYVDSRLCIKELLGDPKNAPRVAAFLGAERFEARVPDANGEPFAVGAGVPSDASFLLALD
ncbi:MAG: GNAT family N-acetyltransferase [Clostridia bacterium]|nr:GNAT family N-acetyltransferase [Clostridia bacterium]